MQNIITVFKPNHFNRISLPRTYSTNSKDWFKFVIGKWNKFFYGGENPYNSRDIIYEQMMAHGQTKIMYRFMAKTLYTRQKARARIVKHNERIRKLEDKITEGVYQTKSFANRF